MSKFRLRDIVRFSIVALIFLSPPAFAQRTGDPSKGIPNYNPATEVTVTGTVEEVKQHSNPGGAGLDVHVIFKTDEETLEVHLGPPAWMADNGFTMAKGDKLEVIGSKMQLEGRAAIVAREVTKNRMTLIFRDAKGNPLWTRTWQH
jgi:hypothetical protein